MGQHFLCDEGVLHRILESAHVIKSDQVLEIGAGIGTLTEELAKRAGSVFAVEIDGNLAVALRSNLQKAGSVNVKIIHRDFLQLNLGKLTTEGSRKFKVVGNLPYQATSPILEKLVQDRSFIDSCYLTIQLEVAQRITTPVGSKGGSSLGVMVQAFADCELIEKIPPEAFFPPPEVHSALISMKFLAKPRFHSDQETFFKVVRSAYNLRRKTIRNALSLSTYLDLETHTVEEALEKAGIDKNRRGETLSITEFDNLAKAIYDIISKS